MTVRDSLKDDAKELTAVMQYRAWTHKQPIAINGFCCSHDAVGHDFWTVVGSSGAANVDGGLYLRFERWLYQESRDVSLPGSDGCCNVAKRGSLSPAHFGENSEKDRESFRKYVDANNFRAHHILSLLIVV